MARSGWLAMAVTALLVAGFGSQPAVELAADADAQVQPLASSLTAFPRWSTAAFGGESDMVGPIVVKVVLLLMVVFIGTGLAGQVGSATVAFVAGWGSLMLSAAVAGGFFNVVSDAFVFDGKLADEAGGALLLLTEGVHGGVQFGLYTGWLVGAAVAFMARRYASESEEEVTGPIVPGVPPVGSAPGYPTVYPPLPRDADWSSPQSRRPRAAAGAGGLRNGMASGDAATGERTASYGPAPATGATGAMGETGSTGATGSGEAAPAETQRSRPAWPPRPAASSGGAYRRSGERSGRPSWTRWSSRDS